MLDVPLTTLTEADKRTRQLARTMFNLNAEGTCTEALLLAEGFSLHEQRHLGPAARQLANGIFVRRDDLVAITEAPLKTDDELLTIAFREASGVISDAEIFAQLRHAGFTTETVTRLWPKLMIKLGARLAKSPLPSAELMAEVG